MQSGKLVGEAALELGYEELELTMWKEGGRKSLYKGSVVEVYMDSGGKEAESKMLVICNEVI